HSIVVFENYPLSPAVQPAARADALRIAAVRAEEHTNYPLTLAAQAQGAIVLSLGYDGARFEEQAIDRLLLHLETVLEALPTARVLGDIPLLPHVERDRLLFAFNDTKVDYADTHVVDLFERQVRAAPDSVALVFEDRSLSYRELDACTNRLARVLLARG